MCVSGLFYQSWVPAVLWIIHVSCYAFLREIVCWRQWLFWWFHMQRYWLSFLIHFKPWLTLINVLINIRILWTFYSYFLIWIALFFKITVFSNISCFVLQTWMRWLGIFFINLALKFTTARIAWSMLTMINIVLHMLILYLL